MYSRSELKALATARKNVLRRNGYLISFVFYGNKRKNQRAKQRALSAEPGTKPAKKRKRSLDLNTAEDTEYVPPASIIQRATLLTVFLD